MKPLTLPIYLICLPVRLNIITQITYVQHIRIIVIGLFSPVLSPEGSASEEADKASVSGQRKKRQAHQGRTDLEVVLDALLDFCGQYR